MTEFSGRTDARVVRCDLTHTHTHTDRTTTVTLAAHARRGLTMTSKGLISLPVLARVCSAVETTMEDQETAILY